MVVKFVFLFILFRTVIMSTIKFETLTSEFERRRLKCEKINAEHCSNIGYNDTSFPNFGGDENAEVASSTLSGYSPLIGTNCHAELVFFLCSVYFPMCTEKVPKPIGPCKPLCLKVQTSCAPLLNEFKLEWPSTLNCDKFPTENNVNHMCMPGILSSTSVEVDDGNDNDSNKFDKEELENENNLEYNSYIPDMIIENSCSTRNSVYVNRTGQCVHKCHSTLNFTGTELSAIRSTLVIGSMISVCLTTICIIASCFQGDIPLTSKKPIEKSLFYCTLCFAISAGLYVCSLLLKDYIACTEYNNNLLFSVKGLPNTNCAFMATLLYYFGSAGRLWWLLLCIAWKWNMKEHSLAEMEQFIFRSHIICWAIPLFLVTTSLMAQSISPELVSGVCLVGSANKFQYRIFIALRELFIMLTAIFVLSSGCLNSINKSDNRIIRSKSPTVGFIGILYPLAACFLLISTFQTHNNNEIEKWTSLFTIKMLADPSLGTLIGAFYFVHIMYSCYQTGIINGRQINKNGYIQGTAMHVQTTGNETTTMYHQMAISNNGKPTSVGTYYSSSGMIPPPLKSTSMSQPSIPQIPVPPVPTV